MAPIRRYLRITKYSVLECRIYLDNPALAQSWLLNPKNPVLPKVIESVRPYVLPKLREERERSKKKSTKKRGIKDVVAKDDFEVSIFLTETSTRHSLLFKHKYFRDTTQTKLTSNSNKLTGASADDPLDVDQVLQRELSGIPGLRREDSDENEAIVIDDVPPADQDAVVDMPSRRPKRRRRQGEDEEEDGNYGNEDSSDNEPDADSSADEESEDGSRPNKRLREAREASEEPQRDDKKKLAMDISYEGFSIYGRVLCLVVKKRDAGSVGRSTAAVGSSTRSQSAAPGGQAMMENWITSTQMPAAGVIDELVSS